MYLSPIIDYYSVAPSEKINEMGAFDWILLLSYTIALGHGRVHSTKSHLYTQHQAHYRDDFSFLSGTWHGKI